MNAPFRLSAAKVTAFALLALTAIVFGRHLGGEFVWDDHYLIENSALMQSPSGWRGLLVTDVWEGVGGEPTRLYHPVPMISLWMQVQMTGLSMIPLRLLNVAVHVANAWLFYRLLTRASIEPAIASAMSLVFAVHPLSVEPAMWLTGRHDTVAVLLGLAGMHASARLGEPRWPLAALAMAITAGGAFASKEPYVVLPALYFAYAILVARLPLARASIGAAAGFAGVGVVMAIRARLHIPTVGGLPGVPIAEQLRAYGTIAGVYGGYALSLTAGPTTRSYQGWGLPGAVAVTLAIAAAGLGSLWRAAKGSQTGARVAFGLAWFAISLSPHVVSLPTLGVLGNRYGYFPLLGLLFALGALVDDLRARARPALRSVVSVAVFVPILIEAPVSSGMASLWTSDIDLFGADFVENPDDPQTLYFLGSALERRGGCAAALGYFEKAAENAPDMARASQSLTACLVRVGKGAQAIAPAQNALRLAPSGANLYNLALALEQAGRLEEAATVARRAVQVAPANAAFQELLARVGERRP